MAKVTVYRVRVYDGYSDERKLSTRMATREGVAIMRGTIVEDSAVEIEESQLERGEQWMPKNFRP
jgi:hypothetical protein